MVVLVSCKNEEDSSKNEGTRGHNISPIISLWGFFKRSGGANSSVPGPILQNFEPIQHVIAVLVTFKN